MSVACRWFDKEQAGYIAGEDLEEIAFMVSDGMSSASHPVCPPFRLQQTQSPATEIPIRAVASGAATFEPARTEPPPNGIGGQVFEWE